MPPPGIGQRAAEGRRGLAAAGQEKGGLSGAADRCRVTAAAMSTDQLPVLPWAVQRRRQKLHAGYSRLHRIGQSCRVKGAAERRCPRVKPGIPAENNRCSGNISALQTGADLLRLVQGSTVRRTFCRQLFQKTARTKDQLRTKKRVPPCRRQASAGAAAHANECDFHNSSLHRCKIASAHSPCSMGRRSTISCTPHCSAARAFSAKPPAAPPSLVTRKAIRN